MEIKYYYNQWNILPEEEIDKIEEINSTIYLWIKSNLPSNIKICPYWEINNKQYKALIATSTGYLKLIENDEGF